VEEDHNTPIRIIKKKVRGHGGAHGGAWKVAYADFVTAMMALFIVLWIVGQSEAVKKAVEAYFKDPGVFDSSKSGGILQGEKNTSATPSPVPLDKLAAEMDKLKAEAGNIEKAIAEVPDFSKFKDKVHVTVTAEGLRIDLVEESEGLFFDIGKATVKPETVKLLRLIATHLAPLENGIVVEGYTDAMPYASSGYSNWNLSTDRANSARMILEGNGLGPHQILQVRGFADRKLRTPDKPLDFSNRRVSILVTPSAESQKSASTPAPAIETVRPGAPPAAPGAKASTPPLKIELVRPGTEAAAPAAASPGAAASPIASSGEQKK
jgi:chemotaxis protein MotB